MKVFISVDIEGITGLVSWSQCEAPGEGYDWEFARRMFTGDVNAAIRGARAAGATEITVKDAHGHCKNLLVEELEPGTRLISGFHYRRDYMMDGVDEGYDAAMLVGYHSRAGTTGGIMAHALVGGLHRFWINGEEAGEIAVSAAVAGDLGVPMTFISSDQAGCEEAKAAIPGIVAYSVKTGYGNFMGSMLHPSETWPGIETHAKESLSAGIQPYVVPGPVTLRAEFNESNQADFAAVMPGILRRDSYSVELTRDTFREAHSAMLCAFILSSAGRRGGE